MNSFSKPLRFAFGLTLCMAASLVSASPADARSFTVSIRVSCPASFNLSANALDPTFATVAQVRCAGIRVVAMDADPLWDEYCGAGYTNSRGIAFFSAECGDGIGRDPEVYAKIEARSVNGFSVGVPDFDLWQRIRDSTLSALTAGTTMPLYVVNALREHRTFQWVTPEFRVSTGSVDFGAGQIGGSAADGTLQTMAARQFWAAQHAMFRLSAGTRYRPMDFNYTVAGLLPFPTPIIFPTPTPVFTAYDTVIVAFTENVEPQASEALQATAHEIGHVLYNTYHSGMLHWLYEDATDYMTNHARCDTNHFQTLAWYEGFAHFIQDYVFQSWNWRTFNWTFQWRPSQGCAIVTTPDGAGGTVDVVVPGQQGMHIEGNVQAMLNNIFFGPVRAAQQMAATAAQFSCPSGQTRIVTPAGVVECQREVLPTCSDGFLSVDSAGSTDQCSRLVDDPNCRPGAHCEQFDEFVETRCAVGSAIRRPGRDTCLVTSPATHSLPGGTPQPRPDGSPDMIIGVDSTGMPAWFSLPDLDDVMDWVIAAGNDGHRAREFWDGWISPWCRVQDGTRPRYCDPGQSSSFRDELRSLDPTLN